MKATKWTVVALLALAGCAPKEGEAPMMASKDMAESSAVADTAMAAGVAPGSAPATPPETDLAALERKMVYTGSLRMQVSDLKAAGDSVRGLLKGWKGYISNERQFRGYEGNGTQELELVLRIPSQQFSGAVSRLEQLGTYISSKEVTASDVTAEYADTEARIKSRKAAEQQYLDIMKRARTVSEVLEVQGQLRQIREEVEAAEGRLKVLRNQVAFSTLTVTLFVMEAPGDAPKDGFWYRMTSGMGSGWEAFESFVIFLVSIWPFYLLAGLGVVLWRRYRKGRKDGAKKEGQA